MDAKITTTVADPQNVKFVSHGNAVPERQKASGRTESERQEKKETGNGTIYVLSRIKSVQLEDRDDVPDVGLLFPSKLPVCERASRLAPPELQPLRPDLTMLVEL